MASDTCYMAATFCEYRSSRGSRPSACGMGEVREEMRERIRQMLNTGRPPTGVSGHGSLRERARYDSDSSGNGIRYVGSNGNGNGNGNGHGNGNRED